MALTCRKTDFTTRLRWITWHPSVIDGEETALLDPLATSYLEFITGLNLIFSKEVLDLGLHLHNSIIKIAPIADVGSGHAPSIFNTY
jgi:hypothetical protein